MRPCSQDASWRHEYSEEDSTEAKNKNHDRSTTASKFIRADFGFTNQTRSITCDHVVKIVRGKKARIRQPNSPSEEVDWKFSSSVASKLQSVFRQISITTNDDFFVTHGITTQNNWADHHVRQLARRALPRRGDVSE